MKIHEIKLFLNLNIYKNLETILHVVGYYRINIEKHSVLFFNFF
jgi:hypothetical protein